jgi:hypothetical protein
MFADAVQEIYSVIDQTTFSIQMVPRDYVGKINTNQDEYFAVQVVFPNVRMFYGGTQIDGLLFIDVFTQQGKGDLRSAQLIDELNSVFQGKTLDNGLQFFTPSINDLGKDSVNPSLKRVEYRLPFKLYGEL